MPILIPLLVLFALGALVAPGTARAASTGGAGGRMPWPAFSALTAQWAKIWGVPELIVWVIGTLESGINPTRVNKSPAALSKGGAWGLFQITGDTARDLMGRVAAFRKFPVSKAWNASNPSSLLDPSLNTMLATYYLSRLWKEFGEFLPTVAAYQQGPKGVRRLVARGADLTTALPPKGRAYVAKALAVRRELLDQGTA